MKTKFHFLLAFCLMISAGAFATIHTVTVANFQFTPASLTAQVGDTVMWMWSNGDHTTTSVTVPAGAATWDSPITQGSQMFMYKLTTPGTYSYHCTPHAPNMAGTINVGQTTGVAGINADNKAGLYPNPANTVLHLDLNKIKGTVSMVLVDAAGRQAQAATTAGGTMYDMDVARLPAGIYMLQLSAGDIHESHAVSIVR